MSKSRQRSATKASNADGKSAVEVIVAKIGLTGTIITAVLGLAAAAFTAYYAYLGIRTQVETPLRATQTAEARTAQAPQVAQVSNTLTAVTSTVLPPLPSQTPTQVGIESPEQFIRAYFEKINGRYYEETWAMLSDTYKADKNPTGFDIYKDYWNTIAKVEIAGITVLSRASQSTEVSVDLLYTFNNGDTVRDNSTFKLVPDSTGTSWLIDE
jgi:hypothetical protein